MAIIGGILLLAAFLVSLIYGIQILIIAFRTSVLWGIGSLLFGIVGLIFVCMHWEETKSPFLRSLLAIPLAIAGVVCMAMGGAH